MKLSLIDLRMLREAIASNTDASEQEAASIIGTVLLRQRKHHSYERDECRANRYSHDVCEALYEEKCDDVIGLCDALRAVLALTGESAEVRSIVDAALREHGGDI